MVVFVVHFRTAQPAFFSLPLNAFVPEMTYYVSGGALNPTQYSLTH